MLRVLLGGALERDEEDKEAVRAGPVLVDGALVGPVGAEELLAALVGLVLDEAGDEEDRERDEELLGLRFDEEALLLVEGGAVEEHAVEVDALGRLAPDLLDALELRDLGAVDDVVEGPLVALVLARHLLLHGREEARRVEEAREPVAGRPAAVEPRPRLVVARHERREPEAERRQDPSSAGTRS